MCYDNDAHPPELPHGVGGGGGAIGEDVTLTAADGNTFMAYMARAERSEGATVLIYPDVRGLYSFYKELAMRFAEAGIDSLAMDYFGRTAGLSARDDAFESRPHVDQMTWPTFTNDVRASVAYLRTSSATQQPVFTVGFCVGGALSLYSSSDDLGLTGVIAFYAGMGRAWDEDKGALPDAAAHARIPVLGLFAGNDPSISHEQVRRLDEILDTTGVAHSITLYDNATHSFFDRAYDEFKEECDDAWMKILEFIGKHKGA